MKKFLLILFFIITQLGYVSAACVTEGRQCGGSSGQCCSLLFCDTIDKTCTSTSQSVAKQTAENEEVVFDYECQKKILLSTSGIDENGKPVCNTFCQRGIIYDTDGSRNDQFCEYGKTDEAATTDAVTVFEYFIPPEDAALIYLRAGLYTVFGLAGLLVILYGLYGWYVRSISSGEPDKVKQSMNIYKNAILGVIIIFSSLLIIQLVYTFLGITQGPFDFNFIPKIGSIVDVKDIDLGRKCYTSQSDLNKRYTCIDGLWK